MSEIIKAQVKEELNFEDSLKKLEEIAVELEKGDLNLQESMTKFEEGIRLSKVCSQMLEQTEKKINILIGQDGNIQEEKFDVED